MPAMIGVIKAMKSSKSTTGMHHRGQTTRQAGRWWASVMVMAAVILALLVNGVCAGFWTFYMPNFLKPSGYSEMTLMIEKVGAELNETIDNYEDMKYFWNLVDQFTDGQQTDEALSLYDESESVCSDILPSFTSLAKEYIEIDFEHFTRPMRDYLEHLHEEREKYYPDGPKSRTILPRIWEQQLIEMDLGLKIESHRQLTTNERFKEIRQKMVNIWKSVKRGLDSSLACVYLKYAYRQMAEDINQFALEYNLKEMEEAMEMVQSAYKRIERFAASDQKAMEAIDDEVKREERMHIRI